MGMDRGEPALVPQWLKNNGSSASSGGGGRQPSFSSSPRTVDHSSVKRTRSVSSANSGVTTSGRTTAAYFHRNPGSRVSAHLQSYGIFGCKSNRNGVYEDPINLYDKERLTLGVSVNGDNNHSDHFGSRLQRKFQKDELVRSKSMNGWRDEDARLRSGSSELSNDTNDCHSSGNVFLGRGDGKINKPLFEQHFPSLDSEDNRAPPQIGRLPSGFQQQLSPTADGWISVLAEAPVTNGSGSSSILASPQVTYGVSAPFPQSLVAPNMAETVAQIPVRARTPLELSVNTQRLEELAIKKSKQLIPMTPNMPRSPMTTSFDKSKTRMVQPQAKPLSSLSGSQPIRAGPLRLDDVKSSNRSKLQILKLSKDLNGVSAAGKGSFCSPNGVSVPTSTFSIMAPPTGSSPAGSSLNHQILAGLEHKPAEMSTKLEKKPSLQAQSRNEFFNCLKKKSSSSIFPACNGGHSLSSTLSENSDSSSAMTITTEMKQGAPFDAPASDRGIENGMVVISVNGGDDCAVTRHHTVNGEEQLFPLNEEEAAFMRSLGWEESVGVDEEGLTEEEINSFLKQRENMGLSSRPLSIQKMALQLELG